MKKIIALGAKGMQNQIVVLCIITMSNKLKDPLNITAGKIVSPIETSYEIICAAERSAPRKAYFELLAQPPSIIP
jgi:hypothetical protein